MTTPWAYEKIWTDKSLYDEAEYKYYAKLGKTPLTPLADEVGKFRQRLCEIKDTIKTVPTSTCLEKKINSLESVVNFLQKTVKSLEDRIVQLEKKSGNQAQTAPVNIQNVASLKVSNTGDGDDDDDDDDVDLFGSDSEEDETAVKIREERLAAYNAKKSNKPAVVAKSSIILDVKPWDDETDMKAMEEEVRKIQKDGLLWGAAKLVPLAYGIKKLQINCVIEDEKVSVDMLQEEIEAIEQLVQSVDIAAFNKI